MAKYDHLKIFRSSYKLTLEIYRASHNFPREYKYTLGQKLKELASDFLNLIILADNLFNIGIFAPLFNLIFGGLEKLIF
jgi:hypothetical protein